MRKLITAIQAMAWMYIYGLAGLSDTVGLSISSIIVKVITALCIIASLQKMKRPTCRSR